MSSHGSDPTNNMECPVCHIEMILDLEYMSEHYGETPISLLPPDYIIYWCDTCEESYNGAGDLL